MSNFRVAMFGHKRIPSRDGGIEKVLTELCPRLVKLGMKVDAFNRSGEHVKNGDFSKTKSNYKGVTLRYVPTLRFRGLAAMSSSFFAALRCAFGSYDIVHIHAEGPAALIWLPHFMGKKCVVTIHGLDWKREKWSGGFASKYIHWGEKLTARYADAIIVLNKDTQEYFKREYGRSTLYIPNGVNKANVLSAKLIHEKFGLNKGSYFLSVSRLTPEKGILQLIKSYRGVKTDKKLVIAGSASDTDGYVQQLKQLAQADDRVMLVGFAGGQALAELYSNAYTYVLPSTIEGMPMSLLEAMSYGNAVAASNIPEISEVVGVDHAKLFNPNDEEQIAEVLQYFVDHAELVRNMATQSAAYVAQQFNWDKIAEQTATMYDSLGEGEHTND